MTALFRIGLPCALFACAVGCVAPRAATVPTAVVTPLRTKVITADSVREAIAIGKSTKADVMAALGETLIIRFESGFEVWVYHLAGDTPAKAVQPGISRTDSEKGAEPSSTAEFVVLFAPPGVVAKTQVRPLPPEKPSGR